MASTRLLENRLRELADPSPPAELQARLEEAIPQRLGAETDRERPWAVVWSFVGVAAAAALLLVLMVNVGRSRPAYAETLSAVATASGRAGAIHLVVRARSTEGEDFSHIDIDGPFIDYDIWVENNRDQSRMRIDKPGREYLFDGKSSTWFHPDRNEAFRREGGEVDWRLLWPASWAQRVLEDPETDVEVVSLDETDSVGRVVMRWPAPDMNGKSSTFFDDFDRELTLEWDATSLRLTRMERRVLHEGTWITVWIASEIEYGERFSDDVFDLEIPGDVDWIIIEPASEQLAALGPRDSALRLWTSAIEGDAVTLKLLCPFPSVLRFFEDNPPTELLHLGEPFQAGNYAGYYVPYEVRFGAGEDAWTKKGDLAMRRHSEEGRFIFDGGI